MKELSIRLLELLASYGAADSTFPSDDCPSCGCTYGSSHGAGCLCVEAVVKLDAMKKRKEDAEAFPYHLNLISLSLLTVPQLIRENALYSAALGVPENNEGLRPALVSRNGKMRRALIARRGEEWFPKFQRELFELHRSFGRENWRDSKDRARIRRAKNEPAT